jgi:hypothetical protein
LVCELFQRVEGNAVLIQKELELYGHRLPYTRLTHLVRSLKLRPEKMIRSGSFTYAPGREAQHDTSPHRVSIAGKTVKAQFAGLVLANCRLLFFQYYPRFSRFCDEIANSKIKRALGMSPRQAYANERVFLKPLPAVKPPVYQALSRTVDLYGYVPVDTNRYSVPEALCGKQVEIHKGLYHLRIFYRMRLIATHPRLIEQRDSGHHSPPVAHKADKHSPLLHQLLGHSPELDAYAKKIAARPAATRHLQRLLALKGDYPAQAFDSAIARGLQYGVYDLSRLEKLLLRVVAGEFFKLGESENE